MSSPSEPEAPPNAWHLLVRSLIGEPELTSVEVAEMAGVDLAQAGRLWLALGFAPVSGDERVFARSDATMLQGVQSLVDAHHAASDVLFQITRVSGHALARVAEAQVQLAVSNHERFKSLRDGSLDPSDVTVQAAIDDVRTTALALEPFLTYVWRRHLLAALVRLTATAVATPEAGNVVTVGFADLVGFTALSQQMDERELAIVVERFEAHAYEQIARGGGRVIKTIGDEVMFAVDDTAVAAEVALSLREAFATEEALPEVRIGLASGPTLAWEGDLFGPTVNLAGRLVKLARPGTLLVSDAMAQQLQGLPAFVVRRMRSTRLKGIGRTRVWALRRAANVG